MRRIRIDRRDIFLLLGMASLAGGVWARFGAAWAAIATGGFLLLFGLLGGDK